MKFKIPKKYDVKYIIVEGNDEAECRRKVAFESGMGKCPNYTKVVKYRINEKKA